MNQLVVSMEYGGHYICDLPEDERTRIQQLLKLELRDGPRIHDTLYIQLEFSKGQQSTSKEVIDRLANRDAPFTRMRIRRE